MRSWLVIAAIGVVAGAAAFGLGATPGAAVCGALAGAALAGATRMLAGDGPAAIAAAAIGALLAIALLIVHGGELATAWLAIAAMAWTIAELARPTTPAVALAPAIAAAILEPACAPLVIIAALRWSRTRRERWAIALPIVGAVLVASAIVLGMHGGALADRWFGPMAPRSVSLAARLGDSLGPLIAVAALAGAVELVRRRHAEIAVLACITGALLVDLRTSAVEPITLGSAALCCALGVARLAGSIRIASGQAIVAATCGWLLLLPAAWTIVGKLQ